MVTHVPAEDESLHIYVSVAPKQSVSGAEGGFFNVPT